MEYILIIKSHQYVSLLVYQSQRTQTMNQAIDLGGREHEPIPISDSIEPHPGLMAQRSPDLVAKPTANLPLFLDVPVQKELSQPVLDWFEETSTSMLGVEEANRTEEEFPGSLSHQIRTPLNGVIGATGLLLDSGLNSQQREVNETLRVSAEALLTVIDDIVDSSGIGCSSTETDKPARIPTRKRSLLGSSTNKSQFKKTRILLAEDDFINQTVAMAQLHKMRYHADAVANGREVLEALRLAPYDVIFMDCQMPEMDGYKATEAIRQLENSSDLPCPWKSPIHIIALTAHTQRGEREKCLAAGMDNYLSKPVRSAELQSALEAWLSRSATGSLQRNCLNGP
jgi:CheY-like chemotaxis protein